MNASSTTTAALSYAARGLHALPLHSIIQGKCTCGRKDCPSPAKHPVSRFVPSGVKDASTDEKTLIKWFHGKGWNVGIATGAISGIIALDIDPRHDGDESLAKLEKIHGVLPTTWRFLTGGGGEHILFRHPGGYIPNSAGKIGRGIDVRGDGGYIVAPPSLHISGRHYTVSVDHDPDLTPLADMPAWLLSLLRPETVVHRKATPPEDWRQLAGSHVSEGMRNNTLARLAGHLLRNRIDPWVAAELLMAWNTAHCLPPMPEAEVLHTIRSIARREILRRGGGHSA